MSTAAATRSREGRCDACIVGIAFALIYVALGQRTMWGVDPWMDLRWVSEGQIASPTHAAYLPAVFAAGRLGESIGLSLHESARALSAIGAAIGIAFVHAASRRLGVSRLGALLVAALVGFAPGVAFYATVVERHGPFFGCAGAVCFVAAAWIAAERRCRPRRADGGGSGLTRRADCGFVIALGLTVGVAFAMHSTGSWLVLIVLPLVFASFRALGVRIGAASWRVVFAGIASGIAIFVVTRIATAAGVLIDDAGSLEFFLQHARAHVSQWTAIPACLWSEFGFALLPVCVAWIAGFWAHDADAHALRGRSVAVCLAVVAYLALTFLILGDYEERGAYTLPLSWPLAHLTVLAWPRRVVAIFVGIAIVASVTSIVRHDTRPHADVAARLRAADSTERPCLLPATRADFELLFLEFPDYRSLHDYLDMFQAAHTDDLDGGRAVLPIAMAWVTQAIHSGRSVWISAATLEFLDAPPRVAHPELGPEFAMALRRMFRLEASGIGTYMRLAPR